MIVKSHCKHVVTAISSLGEVLTLKYGGNEVPTELWNAVSKTLADKVKSGKIESMVEASGQGGKESRPREFSSLDAEAAEALVASTTDVATLEKWRKTEKRDAVRLALANRIETLKPSKSE